MSQADLLSLAARKRVDQICLDFEDAWQSGKSAEIEQFLSEAQGAERRELLRELILLECDYLSRNGQTAGESDYSRRFPEDAEDIRQWLQSAESQVHLEPGQTVGRYTIEKQIGKGGFAVVYLAHDAELQRPVAIKFPRRDQASSAADAERFIEEARTVAQLDHPGIVPIFDTGRLDDGSPFAVMQYVEGPSLREVLQAEALTPQQAAAWAVQIAEAADFAHRQGFVHRDVHPGNVLIDQERGPQLADFGLAVHESDQGLRDDECAGTLAYMAPEQVQGRSKQLDARTDVWMIGVLLYEMLTGRPPFRGVSLCEVADSILERSPKPPRQIDSAVPLELERICLKCLAKEMSQRYSTAGDVATDLKQWLRPKMHSRRLAFAAMAAVLLISLLAAPAFLASRDDKEPLQVALHVRVFDQHDEQRRGLTLDDWRALPVKAGDHIRIEARLNRPMHCYLIWIGPGGEVLPVYPWEFGSWTDVHDEDKPVEQVQLPQNLENGWPMSADQGMETLVLLAREKPLPADLNLAERFPSEIAPLRGGSNRLLRFRNGHLIDGGGDNVRVPLADEEASLNDPVLSTQIRIHERLKDYFEWIESVSFRNAGA